MNSSVGPVLFYELIDLIHKSDCFCLEFSTLIHGLLEGKFNALNTIEHISHIYYCFFFSLSRFTDMIALNCCSEKSCMLILNFFHRISTRK